MGYEDKEKDFSFYYVLAQPPSFLYKVQGEPVEGEGVN